MPQVDLETLVAACAGGGADNKIACETLADGGDEKPPAKEEEEEEREPDLPPESFWLSKDAEFDWFDRNAFYERKESTKGNTNANSNPTSNSASQRFSNNLKSKAAMIGLPKTQKTSYVDTTKRRNCKPPNIRLFPKRPESVGKSVSMAEPSSPKVSCMGRVRSKRGRRKSSESAACAAKAENQSRTGRRVRRVGIIGRFVAIFRSDRSSKPVAKTDEPVPVESPPRKSSAVRNLDSPRSADQEPPGLGGMTRFASGRRSRVSWGTEDLEQRLEDNVSKFYSSDSESGPDGRR
ncbi:uncharacterized protein LOC127790792 [Diospyros lotus]|uniref:uncharacterized protein LOC127790792 n=1 Tax=Diospyros lotus TaxID=55363 RepID=UPI00225054C6|nr:uncharacterized protein LOC127790792 [Diospyros lotus]